MMSGGWLLRTGLPGGRGNVGCELRNRLLGRQSRACPSIVGEVRQRDCERLVVVQAQG